MSGMYCGVYDSVNNKFRVFKLIKIEEQINYNFRFGKNGTWRFGKGIGLDYARTSLIFTILLIWIKEI